MAPYASSSIITGLNFNFSSIVNLADGSDNWPLTWADDGHQYTAWGDGGGFGGSDSLGRVSVGIGRVEGAKSAYAGYNVNGGYNPENASDLPDSKIHGIICIAGTFYAFLDGNGSNTAGFNGNWLYKSIDHGATWSAVPGVAWAPTDFSPALPRPWCFTFIQFGQNYAGARDSYVYIAMSEVQDDTAWEVQTPGTISLARVPVSQIETMSAYEFFSGTSASPSWSSNIADRTPVWQDSANGIMRISLSYNAEIGRYLLVGQQVSRFTASGAHIGIYDAPEPWGPWTTVLFDDAATLCLATGTKTVFWNFSNKWASGNNFVLVGTLPGNDQWGSIEGTFTVAGTTRDLVASVVGQSATPEIAAVILRQITASVNGAGITPDISAVQRLDLITGISGLSATPDVQAIFIRSIAAAISNASLTPDAQVMIARALVAMLSGGSATPAIQAAISRALIGGITGQSVTPDIAAVLASLINLAASIQGDSSTPGVSVQIVRALVASAIGTSITPDISAIIEGIVNLVAGISGQGATPDIAAITDRVLSADITGQSTTAQIAAATVRSLLASVFGQSVTPDIAAVLAELINLAASIQGISITPDITANIVRSLTAAIMGPGHTPDILSTTARQLVAAIQGSGVTPDELILILAGLGVILDPSIHSLTAQRTIESVTVQRTIESV